MPRVSKKELEKFMRDNPDAPAAQAIRAQLENSGTGCQSKSSSCNETQIFDSAENLTAGEAASKVHMLQDKILQGCIDIVEYSIELGQILYKQKKSLKHGQWLEWIDKSIDIGYTQTSHYIKIYTIRDEIRQKMDELREQGIRPSFRKMITSITKKDTRKLQDYQADLKKAREVKKQKEQDKQNANQDELTFHICCRMDKFHMNRHLIYLCRKHIVHTQ